MKRLSALLIALGISGGLAFGKIVYEDTLLSAANPEQFVQQINSVSDRTEAERPVIADDLRVEQLNHLVEHQLDQIARELEHKIDTNMSMYTL